jgi:phage terminase large subunit-like protein
LPDSKLTLRVVRSFRAETLDYVWLDEEPPIDIYTEALTRTNVGASPVWLTFTPLQGVSTVVKRFLHEKSEDRHNVVMTIDDVEHYSNDEKKKIIASYPPHEAEARIKGIPVLGSGRIFPVAEETIAIDNREFPSHWPRIGGMDFGWDQQLNFITTSTSTGYVVLTEMT